MSAQTILASRIVAENAFDAFVSETSQEIDNLQNEIDGLQKRIDELEQENTKLKERLG